jgi:hypothetical protein
MLRDQIEGNPDINYGWYLRPSYAMSRAQAGMHDLLRRQFGLVGGGVFMPHATIKGFFRSDATIPELIAAFDSAVEGHEEFTVYNKGPVPYGRTSVVLDINEMPDGSVNAPLHAMHQSAWNAITPLVHPDCHVTPREPAMDRFRAHLTLAMADLREDFFDEVFAYINEATPIGPDSFTAEYCHLFAFRSKNWAGDWWNTLEWQMLHSWKLGSRQKDA